MILEGRPRNSFVGNLSKSLTPTSGSNIPKEFNVDVVTGVITTAVELDRENQSSYSFQLFTKQYLNVFDVYVEVEDINDETPKFSFVNQTISILEAYDVRHIHDVGLVTDNDEELNSVHKDTVRILSGNVGGVFKLKLTERNKHSYRVYLEIAIKLNRTARDRYVLNISASDKGTPVRTGYMLLTVVVEDYNDCFPQFGRPHYSAVISEDAPLATTVLNITTTDCDIGKNAEVKYEMDYTLDKGRYFGIKQDGHVGFIQTNLKLDYEAKKQYKLRVIATDLGNPPRRSTVEVEVNLRDENDNSPKVGPFKFYSIREDAPINSTVASVKIQDKDSGRNARLDVKLEPQSVFFIKKVSKELYFICLKAPLDRELKKIYKIIVTATDNGLPPKQGKNAASMIVGDVNDNPPKFDKIMYTKDILESEKIGFSVLTVHATDPDTDSASSITYHVISNQNINYSTWFEVNATSGLIYVASGIDREKYPKVVLIIEARDGGIPEYRVNCTVVLNILDVNDNAPEFLKLPYEASVPENSQPMVFVLQVVALDKDIPTNGYIIYSFDPISPPPKDVFSINSTTGNITTLQTLDREVVDEYNFGVIAKDEDDLQSTTKVKVMVKDVNDNQPFFKPDFYHRSILENVTIGSQVVQLQAYDNDTGWNARISYEITSGNKENTFSLDKNNGLITLRKNLDREKLDKYLLKFRAIDNGGRTSLTLATVEIMVQDVNDDPPVFQKKDYAFHVVENGISMAFVGVVAAKSYDQGAGGEISYSIKTLDALQFFSVNNSGAIFTKLRLDHELQSKYIFTVEARDHGNPSLFGYVNVTVFVKDVNDNLPVWTNPDIEISLVENKGVGDVFFVFSASDKDDGKNGEITYSITAGPRDVFQLNPKTGSISLLVPVDYEQVHHYQLIVTASDSGIPSLSSSASVNISILDFNDNTPVLNESYIYVEEDAPINKILFTFHASDKDSGANGEVWYNLKDSGSKRNFHLARDGVLKLKAQLDREKQDKHELYIVVGDFGTPHETSPPTKFTIYVKDVNDETPTFSKKFTFTTIENEKPGTFIGRLTAIDKDIGLNSELQYSLVNSSGEFEIDATTGILQNKVKLDRDEIPVYKVEVQVSDKGVPPRNSTTVADVYVQDVNDNDPIFTQDSYQVNVPENVAKGTIIKQVEADDHDEGPNGSVVYYLNTGNTQGGVEMFQINHTTGEIFIVASLDREIKEFFMLSVVANDKGHPPRDAICRVVVTVLDVNDHKPEFNGKNNDTINIPEKTAVGTVIYIANATDPDKGKNGNITYSLAANGQMFKIDANSGAITLNKPLDYEVTKQYNLQINATDKAEQYPKQKSILQLYINVLDSNDNNPSFKKNPIVASVKEGVPRDTKVYSPIVATDKDSGENSRIVYSIVSQSPKAAFKIHPFQAQLSTDVEIDREDVAEYTLVIKAVDQAVDISKQLSSTVTVKILVLDINDCAPVFTSRNETFVMEDEPVNYTVFAFTAEDKDFEEGGKVVFSITAGNQDGVFELDPLWGSLILKKMVDSEKVESYQLRVKASDKGNPSLSTTINFTIAVQDVNDNLPRFSNYMYQASVSENESNTEVIRVRATDADRGSQGQLLYSIPHGIADDLFIINQTTGVISTTSPLDREKEQTYLLTVYVLDNFFPKYTDSTTVIINVTDKNDNTPFFVRSNYEVKIPENNPPGFVCSVVAQDNDKGINARLVYSIETRNVFDLFTVNQSTGILSTRKRLDREETPIIKLVVRARDSGHPSLSASVNVTVIVVDKNDNAPRFISNELNVSIPAHSLPGTSVLKVTAVDDDESFNTAITYSFGGGAEVPFGLDSTSGLIYTLTYLNASEVDTYNLPVIASDGSGSGVLTQSISVNIFVDDTTSIPLQFTKVFYNVSYEVGVEAGDDILQLEFKNKKLKPGDVEYKIESGQNVLAVGPTQGNVSFTTKPNRGAYVSSVRATLVRDRSNTAVCFVLVAVGQTSQLPSFVNLAYYATLIENPAASTSVVTIHPKTVGNVSFQIVNGNEFNAFQIDSAGKINVNNASALDYERTRNFELDVKGDWGNLVTNIAFAKVYINIRNVDDNAPMFRQTVFVTSIPESNGSQDNRFVTKLRVFDFGDFQLSFAIVSGNRSVFSVSQHTGELHLRKAVYREHVKLYNLTVSVSRGKLSSRTTLLVFITDINNNLPTLPKKFSFKVVENSPKGSFVGRITAVDRDDFSVLKYSFANYQQQHGPFVIDLYTGSLSLIDMLNYETWPITYSFEIFVSDQEFKKKAETLVLVTILDQNDNKPSFAKPSYFFERKEVVPANEHLVQVNATDKDGGANGKITYSITPAKGVTINPSTGIVSTTKPLKHDPHLSMFIDVLVTARDQGLPPLSSKVPFRIRILDENNNPPSFSNISYDEKILENTKVGTAVVTIKATDSDLSSTNKRISYQILRGDEWGKFRIEERTGILRVRGKLDREEKDKYSLLVIAKDDSSNTNNADRISVRITIEDVNDNAPVFQANNVYEATMYEDAKLHTTVLTVLATDKDVGRNKEIKYSISSGNDGGWFSIDQEGHLLLISPLDRDVIPIHRLSVRATDQGNPPKASEISVVIKVNDINDNEPVFTKPKKDFAVLENAPIGSSPGTVKASDADSGQNQLIYYFLVNGTGFDHFEIQKQTGKLITTTVFDYENKSSYSLTIKAEDQGTPTRSSILFTVIQIQSVDEYEPKFLNNSYSFSVRANSKKGAELGSVKAVDSDSGPDGEIIYELVWNVEPFAVNKSSGAIYLTEDFLDYEKDSRQRRDTEKNVKPTRSDSYTLWIKASSGRRGSKSETVNAKMIIDYTCSGCQPIPSPSVEDSADQTVLILIVVLVVGFVASLFLICVFVVCKRKGWRENKNGNVESIGLKPITTESPPGRNGLINPYAHVPASVSNSPASGSSTSGRGSSDGCPDEWDGDKYAKPDSYHTIPPDSGVQVDFESRTLSCDSDVDNSETRSSDVRSDRTDRLTSHLESRESLHEFDDEGGREASGGVDVGNLLYAKLTEADAEEIDQNVDRPRVFKDEGRPDYTGSLSSILGSREELRGHYNYFYTMNQAPQYQPLSEVFSEIGRVPVQDPSRENVLECSPNDVNDISGRTSMLSSVSSLHNRHLDAESTYSSLPMTPNFTPAITPLVTRSPSVSPLTSEAVTPMVSPSQSRPSSMYLLTSRPSSSLIQLAERDGLEDFDEDVNV